MNRQDALAVSTSPAAQGATGAGTGAGNAINRIGTVSPFPSLLGAMEPDPRCDGKQSSKSLASVGIRYIEDSVCLAKLPSTLVGVEKVG